MATFSGKAGQTLMLSACQGIYCPARVLVRQLAKDEELADRACANWYKRFALRRCNRWRRTDALLNLPS